jgi:hypothetical protein
MPKVQSKYHHKRSCNEEWSQETMNQWPKCSYNE